MMWFWVSSRATYEPILRAAGVTLGRWEPEPSWPLCLRFPEPGVFHDSSATAEAVRQLRPHAAAGGPGVLYGHYPPPPPQF